MKQEEIMSIGESETENEDNRHPHADTPEHGYRGDTDGFFHPQSIIRKIGREGVGLLGGGRAILLQLAHPLVAAGVADYSEFQKDPLARLRRTLDLMHLLIFGDRRQVKEVLQRFHAMHARIQGRLPHAAGQFPAGTFYTAADPHLKLWVHATFAGTSLMTYERFVEPLSLDERKRYYADTRVLAHLLDIPDSILPPTLNAFEDYMAAMLSSNTLAVTDTARHLAWNVLNPNVGIVQYTSARLLRFVTAGLLPERFRTAYGLRWSVWQQGLLDSFSRATRLLRPVAPAWLWKNPQLRGDSFLQLVLWPTLNRER